MDSNSLTSFLSRAALTANPLSTTTQGDIIAIFQQEQEHALSLLSLSPLLSSLFVSYASRASVRGSASSTSTDKEEWSVLQDTITSLREENEKLKMEARDMVRKLEMSEASQEMLRSQVSSLNEANVAHREDIKSLRTELVEVKGKYDRMVEDSEAEKATLRFKVSDLETQRGHLRDTVVKQHIRVSKLERPTVEGTLPLRLPNSPTSQRDSGSVYSDLPLPDSPTSPLCPALPPSPGTSTRVNGRLACMSPSPRAGVGLRPHPMARGGLVPGRYKSSTGDLRSESALSGWFADGD